MDDDRVQLNNNNLYIQAPSLTKEPLDVLDGFEVPIFMETQLPYIKDLKREQIATFLACFKLDNIEEEEFLHLQIYGINHKKTYTYGELFFINKYNRLFAAENKYIHEVELHTANPHIKAALDIYNEMHHSTSKNRDLMSFGKIGNGASEYVRNGYWKNDAFSSGKNTYLKFFGNKSCDSVMHVSSCASTAYESESEHVKGLIAQNCAHGGDTFCFVHRGYANNAPKHYSSAEFCESSGEVSVATLNAGCVIDEKIKDDFENAFSICICNSSKIVSGETKKGDAIILLSSDNKETDDSSWIKRIFDERKISALINKILPLDRGLLPSLASLNVGMKLNFSSPICNVIYAEEIFAMQNKKYIVFARHNLSRLLIAELNKLGIHGEIIGKVTNARKIEVRLAKKPFIDLPFALLADNTFLAFRNACIKDESAEKSPNVGNAIDENSINHIFDRMVGQVDDLLSFDDFSCYGKALYAPFGGKYHLTKANAMAIMTDCAELRDVAAVMAYSENINSKSNFFNDAINSVVVSICKLVAAGVSPYAIGLSTGLLIGNNLTDVERGNALATALGVFYAECKLCMPILNSQVDMYRGNGHHLQAMAVGSAKPVTLISNVFSKGNKLYRLPILRDEYGIPDFKYLIRLLHAINMNIEIHNIDAIAVVEGNMMETLASGLAGDGNGIFINVPGTDWLASCYGDFIVSINNDSVDEFNGVRYDYLGVVDGSGVIQTEAGQIYDNEQLRQHVMNACQKVAENISIVPHTQYKSDGVAKHATELNLARPKVFIPELSRATGKQLENAFISAGCMVKSLPFIPEKIADKDYILEFRKIIQEANILTFGGNGYGDSFVKFLENPIISDAICQCVFCNDGLVYSFGEGLKAMIDMGFLPDGIRINDKRIAKKIDLLPNVAQGSANFITYLKPVSNKGPWLYGIDMDKIYSAPVNGLCNRICVSKDVVHDLYANGQVAMEFVDTAGLTATEFPFNPTGCSSSIESLISPDGKVIGRLAHPERLSQLINHVGDFDCEIFKRGASYFK